MRLALAVLVFLAFVLEYFFFDKSVVVVGSTTRQFRGRPKQYLRYPVVFPIIRHRGALLMNRELCILRVTASSKNKGPTTTQTVSQPLTVCSTKTV